MKVVLQDLTKIFPSRSKHGSEVVAVNKFNFEIPDGKLIGLLGPSGCGKSTTLYMICGLQKPSSGKIFFGDDDVTELSPENRGVGLVFQNYALYPHMTVKQNILFPLQNFKGKDKLGKAEMMERAYNAAKLVQIDDLMDRKPNELSGGQQQRVAIARALVKMPRVLLLDEPLSNLDARLRLQTREEIKRIQRETGITTVFVTHDQEEAMSISDFIVVMKLGVVQQIGQPQNVYDDPANLFVAKFLGTPPINVFQGKVEGEKLYINESAVMDVKGVEDQNVTIGIRPEGFIYDKNGPLQCQLRNVEVMGRDVSVVSVNEGSVNPTVRS
ncbi:MAG: ABC transporter ATP-binding protein, partial [Clostridia bacterium]|nr:ABC transporter ATP-binding protein [Clostridia bacterium]